ncbi:MAG TPA: hypothetical protein VG122_22545 [Gemmata sp.]|nr:hypothetical protein [Gemmata sp.]
MKITSFNVTDVGYHYIGLRVLAAMPTASREEQIQTISRNVLKYARDRALRLMLPEPKSNYETVGEKICQELAHFSFADGTRNKGYELTEAGHQALALLDQKKHVELRRLMISVHLSTYTNLYAVVHEHVAHGEILSPVIEASRAHDASYITHLLTPAFNGEADAVAKALIENTKGLSAKAMEDTMREMILGKLIPETKIGVPLFRAMCDRLISLRLLNIMKVTNDYGEFAKSYSPCNEGGSFKRRWHHPLEISIPTIGRYIIYLSEPNMDDLATRESFLGAIREAFSSLNAQAGYYDLPDVRDLVCESLLIPEAAFDEGINALLDLRQPPVTVGLTYDRISGRRKPLVRMRTDSTQIFNLIARV